MRAALLLLLCCCAGFAATREAGFRRMGAAYMTQCMAGDCALKPICVAKARTWCAENQMEPGCAFGESEEDLFACGSMRFLAHDGGTP